MSEATRELLARLAGLRVAVVGDCILDHYIRGDAARISPEAPVPVVDVESESWALGAAGNVAANLAAWGVKVEIVGTLGEDTAGDRLRGLLMERGVGCTGLVTVEAPTIVKSRVVVRSQQLCRLDREEAPPRYGIDLRAHGERLEAVLGSCAAVLLSDYAKGVLTNGLLDWLRERKRPQLLTCDPKPKRPLDWRGLDLLTPNRGESLELAELSMGRHDAFPGREVFAKIRERYAPTHLVVTLGAEGMMIGSGLEEPHRLPTFAREVFDVTGAGDTSIAALTAALAAGAGLTEAARFANVAAGVVVGKFGAAVAEPGEMVAYAEQPE